MYGHATRASEGRDGFVHVSLTRQGGMVGSDGRGKEEEKATSGMHICRHVFSFLLCFTVRS